MLNYANCKIQHGGFFSPKFINIPLNAGQCNFVTIVKEKSGIINITFLISKAVY